MKSYILTAFAGVIFGFLIVSCKAEQPEMLDIPKSATAIPQLLELAKAPSPSSVLTPTPEDNFLDFLTPSVDTLTYHDEIFGLSFIYPASWEQVGELEFNGPDGFLKITELENYRSNDFAFICTDYVIRNNIDLNQVILTQIPLDSGCMFIPSSRKPQEKVIWIFRYRNSVNHTDFLQLEANYRYYYPQSPFVIRFDTEMDKELDDIQISPSPIKKTLPSGIEIEELYTEELGVRPDKRNHWREIDYEPTENCGRFIVIDGIELSVQSEVDLTTHNSMVVVKNESEEKEIFMLPQMGLNGGIRNFCEWDGQWILEAGNFVVLDGQILNHKFGYEDMFGWRLISDKAFYFYNQNGSVFVSFDGKTLPIEYDYVYHYGCCFAGIANSPQSQNNAVRFYGKRDNNWYHVEIRINE